MFKDAFRRQTTKPWARPKVPDNWAEIELAQMEQRRREQNVRRFGGTVVNAFGRGVGWTLGRDLVNGVLRGIFGGRR